MQFNLRPTRRPVSATGDAKQDAFVAQIPEYARIGCFAALKPVLPHFRCKVKLRLKHPKVALGLSEARNLPAHTSAA
jgi:hypothetical protein